ncbi:Bbp16 family capsid cement protein [Breoghania sp.]|uniref:Bbp16 family capsid cement protein n=1 Tax=Breoghania sp. TaxID=2065378 RepID=UPI002AA74769|nr:hypothetical protein [Breoghania sp.]
MIFDNTNMFSDRQAITASAASTNVIDLGPIADGVTRNIATGAKVPLLIQVVEDFASAAKDGTLTVAIQFDSSDTFTPDKAVSVGTFAEADLVAGWQLPYDVVPNNADLRYMRLYFSVGGSGNFTAGAVTAGITMGHQTNG